MLIKLFVWLIRVCIGFMNIIALVMLFTGQVYGTLLVLLGCYLLHLFTQIIQAVFTGTYDGQV